MGVFFLGIFREVSDDNINRKNFIFGVLGIIEEIFFFRLVFGVFYYRWYIRIFVLFREMIRSFWGCWKVIKVFIVSLLRDC